MILLCFNFMAITYSLCSTVVSYIFISTDVDGKYIIEGDVGKTGVLKLKENGEPVERGTVSLDGDTQVKRIDIPVRQMCTVTDNLTKKLLFKKPL